MLRPVQPAKIKGTKKINASPRSESHAQYNINQNGHSNILTEEKLSVQLKINVPVKDEVPKKQSNIAVSPTNAQYTSINLSNKNK